MWVGGNVIGKVFSSIPENKKNEISLSVHQYNRPLFEGSPVYKINFYYYCGSVVISVVSNAKVSRFSPRDLAKMKTKKIEKQSLPLLVLMCPKSPPTEVLYNDRIKRSVAQWKIILFILDNAKVTSSIPGLKSKQEETEREMRESERERNPSPLLS